MSDLTEAIIVALYGRRSLADRHRDVARVVLAAIEPQIRADERAKVAEEIAAAIDADGDGYCNDEMCCCCRDRREAAASARGHAAKAPETAADAISAPPESDRTPEGAETPTGRSDTDTRDDRQEP